VEVIPRSKGVRGKVLHRLGLSCADGGRLRMAPLELSGGVEEGNLVVSPAAPLRPAAAR
jgi:hypothetical protein